MSSGIFDNLNQISKNLYIGDFLISMNYNMLITYNITHIVVCGLELSCRYPREFTYLHIKIADTPEESIREHFEEVHKFISEGLKRGTVLVHCAQGQSRSVSILLSYLMKSKGIRYNKAFEIVKRQHPRAQPNEGFKKQLLMYEKEISCQKEGCISQIF